jgi:hypothetical protein
MKKFLAVSLVGLTFLSASAMAETLRGVVSDSMCAHNDIHKASTPGHADCAKKCIGMGSPAVLIVGDKIYNVSNAAKLDPFAGKMVTVEGKVNGDTLTVASVR